MTVTLTNPLAWPEDWPKTPAAERQASKAHFVGQRVRGRMTAWSFSGARDALVIELDHLGAESALLSVNTEVGPDGLPIASPAPGDDPGVAVYFDLHRMRIVLACDSYARAEDNIQSIVRALDSLRQLERQAGRMVLERALAGFQAIRSPKTCWSVLGVGAGATRGDIRRAYHNKAREAHPDNGGSDAAMIELNRARDEAMRAAR